MDNVKPIFTMFVAKAKADQVGLEDAQGTRMIGRRRAQQLVFESLVDGKMLWSDPRTGTNAPGTLLNGTFICAYNREDIIDEDEVAQTVHEYRQGKPSSFLADDPEIDLKDEESKNSPGAK